MRTISIKDIDRILNSDNIEEEILNITKEALRYNPNLVNPLYNLLHLVEDPNHPKRRVIDCSYYYQNGSSHEKRICHYEGCLFKQGNGSCAYEYLKERAIELFPRRERSR